jgi:glycosyltransferase involved in cell wall biosynthesis
MAQRPIFLASDVGGHRELIKDGETGYLFKAGSKEALCEGILRAYRDQEQHARMGDAGRRFVETERNWKVSVARTLPIYERLLKVRRP